MKAKASICISDDETLIESLEISKSRIQAMIDKGMDNEVQMLKGLIAIADKRIAEIRSGEKHDAGCQREVLRRGCRRSRQN